MTTSDDVVLPFEVRDYECDLQGIVNNAVYQQYLNTSSMRGTSFFGSTG